MDLDRTDRKILAALQNNARLTNKELAARVNLAPSSCLERVRRLTNERVIEGFHAAVDRNVMGIGLEAVLTVQMRSHSRDGYEKFVAHAMNLPEVLSLYQVSGAQDFLVRVAVRNVAHLRDFSLDAFSEFPVSHLETAVIFQQQHRTSLPDYT